MPGTYALIVAAGRGQRFGGDVPKQYRTLAGTPVLARSARAFRDHPSIDGGVRAVIHPDDAELYDNAVAGLSIMPPEPGGATRQESVRRGLESLVDAAPDHVLIHDAARPFIDAATIDRVCAGVRDHGAALAAIPVVDTLKREQDDHVAETVDRAGLWRAQTPQGFRFADILAAHRAAVDSDLTDDAAVAERAGIAVHLVEGAEANVKITTEADFARAEQLAAPGALSVPAVGYGFDVHAFGDGDHVWLCGVRVDHDRGLIGHSDADVALHAATDAVFGAIGDGDIGAHFPDSDPAWRGTSSDRFLAFAVERVAARGGRVNHIDVTIICQAPRIGPHRGDMVARLSKISGLPPSRVSVKATTTERLGFTGRGEGIAAQAVATVLLPAEP